MIKFDGIIVVEGNTDEALLRNFIDAEIVKTGGSAVTRGTIEYLQESAKNREIIVLTDPDFPGMQIRNKLDSSIKGLKHAFLPKNKCIKKGKVGVAESSKEVIIDALNNLITNSDYQKGNLSLSDLVDLGLLGADNSSFKRDILEAKFHIGHTNGKTLLKRLNSLNVSRKQLEEALDEQR